MEKLWLRYGFEGLFFSAGGATNADDNITGLLRYGLTCRIVVVVDGEDTDNDNFCFEGGDFEAITTSSGLKSFRNDPSPKSSLSFPKLLLAWFILTIRQV